MDAANLYLGMCGTEETRKGHQENVNQPNESAAPTVGCALCYIKAALQQKRPSLGVDPSGFQMLNKSADSVKKAVGPNTS